MTVPAPPGFRFYRENLAVPAAIIPDRVRRQLTITEAKENGQLRIVLPATRLDWENLNRRIYPTEVMQKAIESPEFRANMDGGFLICSGRDHPKTPYVAPTEGSHIITKAWIEKIKKESYLMNEWLTLNTTEGRNLRGLFEGGAAFGVSIRGFGRIEEGEEADCGTLAEYMYIGTDGVGEPSAKLYAGMKVPNCKVVECVTSDIKMLKDRVVVSVNYPKALMESKDTVKLVGFEDRGKITQTHDDDYVTVQWEDGAESRVMLVKTETDQLRIGGTVCIKSKTEGNCMGKVVAVENGMYDVKLPSGTVETYSQKQLEDFRKDVDNFKECSCMEDEDSDDMCECPAHAESINEKRTTEPDFAPVGLTAWKKEMKKLGAIKFTSDGPNLTFAWNAEGKEVGYWVDIFNVGYDFKGEATYSDYKAWKHDMKEHGATSFKKEGDTEYALKEGKRLGVWDHSEAQGLTYGEGKALSELHNDYGKNKTALTGPGGNDAHIHSYDPTVAAGITGMGGEDLHTHVFNASQLWTAPGGTDGHTHQLTQVFVSAESILSESTSEHYDPQSNTVANLVYAIRKLSSCVVEEVEFAKKLTSYRGGKRLDELHWKTLQTLLSELKSDDYKYTHSVQVLTKEQVIEMAKQKRVQELGVQEPGKDNSVVDPADKAGVAHANDLTVGTDVTLGSKKAKVVSNDGTTIGLTTDQKEDSSWPIASLKKDAAGAYFVQTEKVVSEAFVVGNVKVKSIDRPAGANYVVFTPEDPSQYLPLRNAVTAQGAVMYAPIPEGQVAMILDPAIDPFKLPWITRENVIRENVDAMISDLVTWFNATPREKVDEVNRIFSKYGVEPTENLEGMVTGLKGLKLDDLNGLHVEVAAKCAYPAGNVSYAPVPVDTASYEALKAVASKTLAETGKVSAMRLFMGVEEQLNKIDSQTILPVAIGMLDKLKNEMFGSSEGARTLKKPHSEGKIVDQVNSLSRMIKEAYAIAEGIGKLQISDKDKKNLESLIEYVSGCEDLVVSSATMVESKKQEVRAFLKDLRKNLVIEGDLKSLKDALGIVEQSAHMIHNLKATLEGTQSRVSVAMHLLEHLRVFQRREYNTLKTRAEAAIKLTEHLRTRMKLMVAKTEGKAVVPAAIAEAVGKIISTRPELGNYREELMTCSKSPEHAIILAKKYLNVKSIETVQPLHEESVLGRNVGIGERHLPAGLR